MHATIGRILPLLPATLALSACGGGGTPGLSSTGSPPPSSGSTYTKIVDLTGSQTFNTASASTIQTGSGAPSPFGPVGYSSSVTVSYNLANDSYTLQGYGVSDSFVQADLRPSGDPKAVYLEKSSGGTITASTRLVTPSPGGVDLSYVRYGYWYTTKDTAGAGSSLQGKPRTTWLVGGVQTQVADVPTTGNATYTGNSVVGVATEPSSGKAYDLGKSTATFSANFAANTLATTLNLIGAPFGGGADKAFGSFNGTGTIGSSGQPRNVFDGTFGGNVTGNAAFKGAFFGPAATEYGYAYSILLSDLVASGAVAGKQ